MNDAQQCSSTVQNLQPGWYDDPHGSGGLRFWNGMEWTSDVGTNPVFIKEAREHMAVLSSPETAQTASFKATSTGFLYESKEEELDYPIFAKWSTSIGFSIFGLMLSPVFQIFLMFVFLYLGFSVASSAFFAPSVGVALIIVCALVQPVLYIVYALVFYSSFFTKRPRMQSSQLISFANCLIGGVVFGCIWNRNLTKSAEKKQPMRGIAYIVFVVLEIIVAIGVINEVYITIINTLLGY